VRTTILPIIILLLGLQSLPAQTLDSRYHTYEEVNAYLDSLSQIPLLQGILSVQEIGMSNNENLPIMAAKLSDNPTVDEDEAAVLFLGQCHAEEILGLEISIGLIDTLIHGFQSHNSHILAILQNMEIWIVPTYNPEGLRVVHGFQEDSTWVQDITYRKNRTDNNQNGIFDYSPGIGYDYDGVDANRNYSFNWIHGDVLGFGDYDYFRGTAPFSESESRTIRDLALSQFFTFSVAYHSARSGIPEIIYYPWEWDETKYPPGYALIDNIAQELGSRIINEAGDGHYAVTPGKTMRGNTHDWFYTQTGSLSYLIEVGTNNLQPGRTLINDTVRRNLVGCFYLIDRALGYPTENRSQLRGIVRNAVTGEELEGAEIKFWKLNVSQVYVPQEGSMFAPRLTDQFGRYRHIAQQGTYKMVVSMAGFEPDTVLGITTSSSFATDHDFSLNPYPENSLELTLSSSDGANDLYLVEFDDAAGCDSQMVSAGTYQMSRRAPTTTVSIFAPSKFPQRHTLNLANNGNAGLSAVLVPSQSVFMDNFADMSHWSGNGNWSVSEGKLKTQPELFYSDNTHQTLTSQRFNVTGMQQLAITLQHQYEVEWDLDTLAMNLYSGDGMLLLSHHWIDQNWEGLSQTCWTSDIAGVDSAYVVLTMNTDSTVYFRGWQIEELTVFGTDSTFTGIDDDEHPVETTTFAHSAQILAIESNPMQESTAIRFQIPQAERVTVRVFNVLGQEVYQTRLSAQSGVNNWRWNGQSNRGHRLAAGVYLVHFQARDWHATQKLLKITTQG